MLSKAEISLRMVELRNLRKLELNYAPLGSVIFDLQQRLELMMVPHLVLTVADDNADDAERDGGLGSGKWLGVEA